MDPRRHPRSHPRPHGGRQVEELPRSCSAQILARRADLTVIAESEGDPGNHNDPVHYRESHLRRLYQRHGKCTPTAAGRLSMSCILRRSTGQRIPRDEAWERRRQRRARAEHTTARLKRLEGAARPPAPQKTPTRHPRRRRPPPQPTHHIAGHLLAASFSTPARRPWWHPARSGSPAAPGSRPPSRCHARSAGPRRP